MPLELSGTIVRGIRVDFDGGRAVKIDAESGAEALRSVAARDDGASRLGEIALVDGEGRIGPLGRVFYDTLIDENAASHIALGDGYDHPVDDPAEQAPHQQEHDSRRFHDREPGALGRRDHARRRARSGASRRRLADLRALARELRCAGFGDLEESLAELFGVLSEIVEARERCQTFQAEHALEQRRRSVANRTTRAVLPTGLTDQATLDEAGDGRVGSHTADSRDVGT